MDGWRTDIDDREILRVGGGLTPYFAFIGSLLLFVTLASSFYVQTESRTGDATPAPYDLLLCLTMALYFAFGLKFPRKLLALAVLWGLFLLGYGFSGIGAPFIERVSNFLLVSVYLVASTLFFAALVAANPARNLSIIWWAYVMAAFIAAALGVGAYFGLVPNGEGLLLYSRVKSTFNDPNVFGPFLVAPILFLVFRLSMSSSKWDLMLIPLLGVLFLAILLSFSRGAWGNLIASGGVFLFFTWKTASSARQITRLTFAVIAIIALGACVVTWALSSSVVSELFEQRFSLTQSYDVSADSGRFAVQELALQTVLTNPLGIGPSQWAKIAPADPHNVYLNIFLAGGWLSGFAFVGMIVMTLYLGVRSVFVSTGIQGLQIIAVATFVGHVGEAFIIDIDNWRHVYLLIGLIWGGIAVAEVARRAPEPLSVGRANLCRDGFAI
ncbi:MAG: O-antigen ligase family protein [Parvibaculum sp.]